MFASNINFLCMKVKSFCLFKTERANNHIKQSDTCFFARNTIGVTYYGPTAMFTSVIHNCLSSANIMPYWDYFSCHCPIGKSVALTDYEDILPTEQRRLSSIRY